MTRSGSKEPQKEPQKENHNSEIIYVLRTAQQHHVQLSFMADQKANIIIGSFLVYCTLLFTYILKNNFWHLALVPVSVSFLISFIFALSSLLPSLNRAKSNKPNLLFFHGFTNLSEESYVDTMMEKLNTGNLPREMILKDIYLLGQVLRKKYLKLKISYFALLAGVILSLLVFIISVF